MNSGGINQHNNYHKVNFELLSSKGLLEEKLSWVGAINKYPIQEDPFIRLWRNLTKLYKKNLDLESENKLEEFLNFVLCSSVKQLRQRYRSHYQGDLVWLPHDYRE